MDPVYRPEVGQRYSESYDHAAGVPVSASPAQVRAAFLQKVYVTLFAGLAIAMGTAFYLMETAVTALRAGQENLLTSIVTGQHLLVTFLVYIGMAFAAGAVSRMRGVNLLVYGLFTAATGVLISPLFLMAFVKAGMSHQIIWNAFGITALVFGGLTLYVFVSKRDFSFLGGMLFIGLLVLLGFIGASFFFPAIGMGVTVGGIALFALFVLYDTSRIMNRLDASEWVAGALSLFVDFINLFIRILSLLSRRR